jgi:hypothetical protein
MANSTGIMNGFFNSPRNQRRVLIVSALVLAAGITLFVALVLLKGTKNAFTDTISNKPAQLYHPEKTVPVSKAEIAVARRFIQTAVARTDLNAAYDIVHTDLKGRLTRSQWNTGNIPVISYPARNSQSASFQTDYSYQTSALLEVDLVAKPGSDQRPHLLFFVGLKRAGGKPTGRWLVNYWQPHWRPPVPEAVH